MSTLFESIHNHHEQAVFDAVRTGAAHYPLLVERQLLADVACVALNRLPARYIRHEVDFSFYLSEQERARSDRDIDESVQFAFNYVQARTVMLARS